MRKTTLVKISGDLVGSSKVLGWLKDLTKEYFVVICVGGGTQINKAFSSKGLSCPTHGPLGRETTTFAGRQLARNILETNQSNLQDKLAASNIVASVVIPVLDIGTVLCHVNGDTFVLAAYNGYDTLYIITTESRVPSKQQEFNKYPKILIKGF